MHAACPLAQRHLCTQGTVPLTWAAPSAFSKKMEKMPETGPWASLSPSAPRRGAGEGAGWGRGRRAMGSACHKQPTGPSLPGVKSPKNHIGAEGSGPPLPQTEAKPKPFPFLPVWFPTTRHLRRQQSGIFPSLYFWEAATRIVRAPRNTSQLAAHCQPHRRGSGQRCPAHVHPLKEFHK